MPKPRIMPTRISVDEVYEIPETSNTTHTAQELRPLWMQRPSRAQQGKFVNGPNNPNVYAGDVAEGSSKVHYNTYAAPGSVNIVGNIYNHVFSGHQFPNLFGGLQALTSDTVDDAAYRYRKSRASIQVSQKRIR